MREREDEALKEDFFELIMEEAADDENGAHGGAAVEAIVFVTISEGTFEGVGVEHVDDIGDGVFAAGNVDGVMENLVADLGGESK
jgi:hypothetical protein